MPAAVLGRGLTAGCLLATLTKEANERVRIAMRGDGPLGRMLIDAHGDGRVRGCFVSERAARMKMSVPPGRVALGPLIGAGQVTVTRDLDMENTYQGIVELESGEIDEDLERYLNDSEQLPSVLRAHVVVDAQGDVVRAAGVLLQTFPGADPEELGRFGDNLRGDGLVDVLRQDRSVESLMGFAMLGAEYTAQEPTPLTFTCECGRTRALSVVSTLGADDIDALAKEQGGTQVQCSYCGDAYALSKTDLHELAEQLRSQQS